MMLKEFHIKGILLLIISIGLFALTNRISFQEFNQYAQTHNIYPSGEGAPWYFILHDFVEGTFMLGYLIISILLGIFFGGLKNTYSRLVIFFGLLWSSHAVWRFFFILFGTKNLLDSAHRVSIYHNFNQYLYDPKINVGSYAYMVAIVILFVYFNLKYGRYDPK